MGHHPLDADRGCYRTRVLACRACRPNTQDLGTNWQTGHDLQADGSGEAGETGQRRLKGAIAVPGKEGQLL